MTATVSEVFVTEQNEDTNKQTQSQVYVPGITPRPKKTTVFKELGEDSKRFSNTALFPTNLKEQKERFMRYGLPPKFQYSRGGADIHKAAAKERYQIKTELFFQAKSILDQAIKVYGNSMTYADEAFGPKIGCEAANSFISQYLKAHDLDGNMTVYWSPNLVCSAKMMWVGPSQKFNKPEARKYSFIIKNSPDNVYLREDGIKCLVNHEIGSHYVRFYNDGYQPWFSDRKRFGLVPEGSRKLIAAEEGLAALNTLLAARTKYLWGAALLYYTACKGAEMNFRQLYDHMARYIQDKDLRWRHVMRVKRGVTDANQKGGYGHDQVYFEGAVAILQNIDNIDFTMLHCGRVCYDEVSRVKRLTRMDCVKLPSFLKDIERYKRMLKYIAYTNGLGPKPARHIKPEKKKASLQARFKMPAGLNNKSPEPKPKKELPTLPDLLNFRCNDPPVEIEEVVSDDDASCTHCFIYPKQAQFPVTSTSQPLQQNPEICIMGEDCDSSTSDVSETESTGMALHMRREKKRKRKLLKRPTSSPNHVNAKQKHSRKGRVSRRKGSIATKQ